MVKISRSIKRETAAIERRRPITVKLLEHYCCVGVKGTRERYLVPWMAVLDLGRKFDAREKIAARVKERDRRGR